MAVTEVAVDGDAGDNKFGFSIVEPSNRILLQNVRMWRVPGGEKGRQVGCWLAGPPQELVWNLRWRCSEIAAPASDRRMR